MKRQGESLLQNGKRCNQALYDAMYHYAVTLDVTPEHYELLLKTSLNTTEQFIQQMSFKEDKVGYVFWPGTMYLVQSLSERVVVAKKQGKNIVPLDEVDLQDLKANGIPARYTNLSAFSGQKGPPNDLVKLALDTLFS